MRQSIYFACNPRLLDFLIQLYDNSFKNKHGADQGAVIGTALVLGALQIFYKLLHNIDELEFKCWISTVKDMIHHFFNIGIEPILIVLVVVVISALLLLFYFLCHRHIQKRIIVLIDNLFNADLTLF